MFWTAIGVGLGIGIVHVTVLVLVQTLIKTPAKTQADETIELMVERNEIDRQKVAALDCICERMRAKTGD